MKIKELNHKKAESDITEYYEELENHDWYYVFSDNYEVYLSGRKSEKHIYDKSLLNKKFRKLYLDFSKHMFSGYAYGTAHVPKPLLKDYV